MLPFIVGLVAAGLVAGIGVGMYNTLVRMRNEFKAAFAQIDVQLKRRHDLIPNLVETAKCYLKHERETLENVTTARNQASAALQRAAANPADAAAVRAMAGSESALSGALGRLFAVAESYPDLKANQNMMQLSSALSETENMIAGSRQAYNESVRAYNTYRESFPQNVVAGMFTFGPAELFEIANAVEREAPKVSFS